MGYSPVRQCFCCISALECAFMTYLTPQLRLGVKHITNAHSRGWNTTQPWRPGQNPTIQVCYIALINVKYYNM